MNKKCGAPNLKAPRRRCKRPAEATKEGAGHTIFVVSPDACDPIVSGRIINSIDGRSDWQERAIVPGTPPVMLSNGMKRHRR